MVEKTTLSVSKGFAEKLRNEYEGSNDFERLENWADSRDSGDDYKNVISLDDLDDTVRSALRDEVPDLLRSMSR